ncbi:MAG: NAD(P)-dependent oxidoreductase, partial [Bryobacterales bacterium]|nr:NAD(P)-dependent oxidoreductase [Bryobacterales bacterium]
MRLLLTGAAGFLGRNLLRRFPPGWQITALHRGSSEFEAFCTGLPAAAAVRAWRCDLANPEDVAALCAGPGAEWDACVYLAAKVDIPWSVREPAADLAANTVPLLNLLERIRAGRFLYFSSGAVYDGAQGEARAGVTPVNPTLPYAISKFASERYVECYAARRRTLDRFLNVRFFGAYGPDEASHKIYTRLIRAFCLEGARSYTVYGDGRNLIDAMYVDDAVDAVAAMLDGAAWNRTIDLAAGAPMTIETLVQQAGAALTGGEVTVEKQGVAHESNQFWGTTADMKQLYGFVPRVPLAEGIRRFRDA